ncbi:PilZ domain-containing protein [Geoalkalibacter ferrihydriticus]|uniref:PilZ domain-containing protein n=1 Tax=Geoalkalibacter ferrihydriticus TaxID=392333 RepID=A0A1G9J1Y5_9BACT|nr:PilZ domain-containing protein [Geoalkalibacter ferrihydriticus]SDL31322.1 PilZ domain-containing protein [Geoalkalibacter ferrihydriticus]
MEEKRRFGRIPFGSSVTLEIEGQEVAAHLLDLSLKGAKVSLPLSKSLNRETPCRFLLRLADHLTLDFRALIVHQEGETLGLKFVEADPESFAHLLRLMELNSGDSDKIEREMQNLGS